MWCDLRAASPPEVGFCLPGSPGISSSDTEQVARIGVPLAANNVYLADTEVTKAGKLVIVPQLNTTNGGDALFLPTLSSVGTQQPNSFSTAMTTLPSWVSEASKNISRVSLHGSAPLNSGGPAFLAPRAVLRSHLAVLAMVTSLGLNWKSMLPREAPNRLPPVPGVESYNCRLALSTCGRACPPAGDGRPTFPPPAELFSATASVITHPPRAAAGRGGRSPMSPWRSLRCPGSTKGRSSAPGSRPGATTT